MMKFILTITLFLSVLSLLLIIYLWINLNTQKKKRRQLRCDLERIRQDVERYLQIHEDRLSNIEYNVKQIEGSLRKISQSNTKDSPSTNGFGKRNNEKEEKKKENKKEQKNIILKKIYLDLNSKDFFPDNGVSEQKLATSKFVANLTSPTEGNFAPIDVERIRSANVSESVRQSGPVSIKDALEFKVVDQGKIHKDNNGWVIDNPVVIEYIK